MKYPGIIFKCIVSAALLMSASVLGHAQRFSVGTDAIEWLELGTMNLEASVAVAQNLTLHAGAGINPWTFAKGNPEKQLENRVITYWGGARWWPWYVYSGWWAGVNVRYMLYNRGGIFNRQTEEAEAIGGGLMGGYSIMLSDHWNLDLGVGFWSGSKKYTVYECPVCGVVMDEGRKMFFVPDARVVISLIF